MPIVKKSQGNEGVIDELEDIGSIVTKFFDNFREESKKSISLQRQLLGISKDEKKDLGFRTLGDIIGKSNKSVSRSISAATDATRKSIGDGNRILSKVSNKVNLLTGISELFVEIKKSNRILTRTEKVQKDISERTKQSSQLRLKVIADVLDNIYGSIFKSPTLQERTLHAVKKVESTIRLGQPTLLKNTNILDKLMAQYRTGIDSNVLMKGMADDTKVSFNHFIDILNTSQTLNKELKVATTTNNSTIEKLLRQNIDLTKEIKKLKIGVQKHGIKSIIKNIPIENNNNLLNTNGTTKANNNVGNTTTIATAAGKIAAVAVSDIYQQAVKPLNNVTFGTLAGRRVGGTFGKIIKSAFDSSSVQLSMFDAVTDWKSALTTSFVSEPIKTTKSLISGFSFLWEDTMKRSLAVSISSLHAQFGVKGAILGGIVIGFGKVLKKINPQISMFTKNSKEVEKAESKTSSSMKKMKNYWTNLPDHLTIWKNKNEKSVVAAKASLSKKKFEQSEFGMMFGGAGFFKSRSKAFTKNVGRNVDPGDTILGEIKGILLETKAQSKTQFASQKKAAISNKTTNNEGDINIFGIGGLGRMKTMGLAALKWGRSLMSTVWGGLKHAFRFVMPTLGIKGLLSGVLKKIGPLAIAALGFEVYELFKKIFEATGLNTIFADALAPLFDIISPGIEWISNFIDAIIKPFSTLWDNFKERFAIEFPRTAAALGISGGADKGPGKESTAKDAPTQARPEIPKGQTTVIVEQNKNGQNGQKVAPVNVIVPPAKNMPKTSVEDTLIIVGQMGH